MDGYPTELLADQPPQHPPLLEVGWLIETLSRDNLPRLHPDDWKRIAAAFGGVVPHPWVVRRWCHWLMDEDPTKFSGGPAWYRYTGDAPLRVDHATDVTGTYVGGRVLTAGDVFGVWNWNFQDRAGFEPIRDPNAKAKKDAKS